ncbi:hypothetical protein [Amycolatopsis jejuensis]|uniref:hypothetical protein n=1 Tax=Amycolatopsis jejuensis TaxID=330084 RepID=UPI000525F47F|nr:hypothetical protein [Amycolatopsis jejuensis]
MNHGFDLPGVLRELLYGTGPVEETLDRVLTPAFVQRINGEVFHRDEFAPHVEEMRQLVTGGGEMQVLQQVVTETAIAGRYLFRMVPADGPELVFESHLFAGIEDGKVASLVEVARQVADADGDLLAAV